MFCGGRDELVVFANIFVASRRLEKVTLALVSTIKAVVTSLFKDHDERLCSSPERPDLRLSQEEAMGYLAGILVVGQLLPDEARPVGKRLDSRACQEKKTKEKEKEKARQRKKDLRRKKGASEDLENKCEAIDEAVAVDQAARLAKEVDLELPKKESVVVEPRTERKPTGRERLAAAKATHAAAEKAA